MDQACYLRLQGASRPVIGYWCPDGVSNRLLPTECVVLLLTTHYKPIVPTRKFALYAVMTWAHSGCFSLSFFLH